MKAYGQWTAKVRQPGKQRWVVVRQGHNVVTVTGLNAFSSAIASLYTPPTSLAINGGTKAFLQFGWSAGQTGIGVSASAQPTLAGDTQIVIGFGLSTQETVNFSAVTFTSGTYNYTTSPLAFNHFAGEVVMREVEATDTMTHIMIPVQYDSVNAPSQWPQAAGAYSSGAGQYTAQFYFLAGQCASWITDVGLTDGLTIGGPGSLHNHFHIGYDNSLSPSDMEIDSVLTFTNG